MFIQVRLLTAFSRPLWYKVPAQLPLPIIGTLVDVPVRNKITSALVVTTQMDMPHVSFAIKEIGSSHPFPADTCYFAFVEQLSNYYQLEPVTFIKRIRHFVESKELAETDMPLATNQGISYKKPVQLTGEQQSVCDFILPHIINPTYAPTVLHGVTGSGKTEIYKMMMQKGIELGKSTLLLLPEVSLATVFEQRLRTELPNTIPLFAFHSATTAKQKKLLWHHLQTAQPCVIIGVHLPILLPIPNLGSIIIDEEHETGYQEKKHPKINTKEAAIMRAHIQGIPIILGSATPSISTLYNVKARGWHFFQLKKRFAGQFPTVQTILLTDKKERRNFWISQSLHDAIKIQLQKKEQTILFINRRGFSFFVQCASCSHTFSCNTCSVSLTLHAHKQLICHYCGTQHNLPSACPQCKEPEATFIKKGIGTQQVVSILQYLFPTARIARADLDTTKKKKEWNQIVDNFTQGSLDILVGTQTITKGYHFPNVTLVGVIWADLNLNFPMYNAAESALQQLIQVAGRAGRQSEHSSVIVQAMAEHTIFNYLNEVDYLQFYQHEIATRQQLGYPPTQRFAELELKHSNEDLLTREAHMLANQLYAYTQSNNLQAQVLGPAQPPVYKVKNTFSKKIYIKSMTLQDILKLVQTIQRDHYHSTIFYTPNPVT
jgi:primosomal protein N' (replication factor Y)